MALGMIGPNSVAKPRPQIICQPNSDCPECKTPATGGVGNDTMTPPAGGIGNDTFTPSTGNGNSAGLMSRPKVECDPPQGTPVKRPFFMPPRMF